MSALALPRPDNLRGEFGALVESDVYNICDRIKEIDPNLYVYVFETDGDVWYSIAEMCADGLERLVFRTHELDGRIIERLQFLLNVPFEERFAQAERMEEELEEQRMEADAAELYESMGRPMLTDLERCGFIQRPVSYPKRGVTGGKGSRKRA